LTAHLQETNEQLKRLEQCLEACGETTSALKDTAQSVMANAMAMTHAMAGDEILKNTSPTTLRKFRDCSIQIATGALRPAGADNTRAHLEVSLREEEQMAQWVAANVEKVTMAYVAREARAAA